MVLASYLDGANCRSWALEHRTVRTHPNSRASRLRWLYGHAGFPDRAHANAPQAVPHPSG